MVLFITGDLPARNFEAGHTGPQSLYSCICGICSKDFPNPAKILSPSPFNCLADRVEHFGRKPAHFSYKVDKHTKVGIFSFNQIALLKVMVTLLGFGYHLKVDLLHSSIYCGRF